MKALTILKRSLLGLAVVPVILFASGSKALAAQIPFVPGQPLPTTPTPVFNIFTNIPFGVGDESDFVRLRPGNGDSTDSGTNGDRNGLYTDTLNAACNVGDMYDVRTYVHNGADPAFNNNGTGTAVAKGVKLAMTANIGATNNSFPFTSTLTSTNTATVTDKGTLNCGHSVRLELVPTSVKAFTIAQGWTDVSVNAVNGNISIGSHVMNSGDVWGCWDERIQIVYTVKVVEVPKPPITPEMKCDELKVSKSSLAVNEKFKTTVKFTAKNGASFKKAIVTFGDEKTDADKTTVSSATNGTFEVEHSYAKAGTFNISTRIEFDVNGATESVTDSKCTANVTVVAPQAVLAATTTTPTLPATGAGSVIGIFAGTSIIGAFLYRMRALRGNR